MRIQWGSENCLQMLWSSKKVADNLESQDVDVDRCAAVATRSGAARIATARRRLMLGAAAVLPSVVTLRSGAQSAAQSFNCGSRGKTPGAMLNSMGVPRFTDAPDEWLRKKVFSGRLASNGRPAYCTTWDQPNILAIAKLESAASGLGYKASDGTTWSDGQDFSFRIGKGCPPATTQSIGGPTSSYCYAETVDNISPDPDHYGLVYVDETGLSCSLEPGPGMAPVRAACWASIIGDRGTNLG